MQNSRIVVPATFTLLAGAILALGCQREPLPDGMPELHPVHITVIQDGAPLSGASIRLIPANGTSPWSSGGSTDENGIAVVRTHGKYEGAPTGSYKVTVSKIEMPAPASTDLGNLDTPPTADETTYDLVAPQYAYPNQTPLLLEVTAGENTQELDVGAAVRIPRKGPPSP